MKLVLLFFVILCFFASACEEREVIDPKIHILGKWETTEIRNWPDMHPIEPSGFVEYKKDSVVLFFDYKANAYTSQSTYWITDSLLTERITRPDGQNLSFRRSHVMRKNWMRLDFIDILAMNKTAVFRRIR